MTTRLSRGAAAIAVGTCGTLVLGAGVGYAYWSASASGTATGKSATAKTITVTAVTPGAGDLYPGGTGAVAYTLTNDNSYATSFTRLTAASVVSDDTGACPNANIAITPAIAAALAAGYTVPAQAAAGSGATSSTYTIPGLLTMAASAPDGCQGKTFTVTLTLTGSQV